MKKDKTVIKTGFLQGAFIVTLCIVITKILGIFKLLNIK